MRELLATYDTWRSAGLRVGRAVVIRTVGSAPRAEGAVLLVAEDGRMIGSVSGGCVEGAVAEEVGRARETGRSRVIRYGISDEQAWDVGLACGGTIDVLVEPEVAAGVVDAARTLGLATVTPLPEPIPPAVVGSFVAGPGQVSVAPIVVSLDTDAGPGVPPDVAAAARRALATGRSGIVDAAGRAWFVEAYPEPPRLVTVGATEIARYLMGFAHDLGYVAIVVDPRPAFAAAERFPDVDQLLVAWPDEAFDRIGLGPSDAVAVLSHDPKIDEPAIVEASRRGAGYVGAVGSRRSQAARAERLLAAGLAPGDLERMHGPIGLDLGGREPVETALAIMAEVVATRRGGTGGSLRDGRGPIAPQRRRERLAMVTTPRVRAVVLAAGLGRRFGGGKALADLEGRPLLQHVLDALAAGGHPDPVVVLGLDAAKVEARISWRQATVVVNPAPEQGLASSLQTGWAAAIADRPAEDRADAVLVALADQPRLDPEVVHALTAAPLDAARPLLAPAYAQGGGRNPVRVEVSASHLVAALFGDRGLGPLIEEHPELVRAIDVPGSNPDVDRPADLRAVARRHGRD